MFMCALDVTRSAVRMTLTAYGSDPVFLEGRCLPRPFQPARILKQLRRWRDNYSGGDLTVVGCRRCTWPAGLEAALKQAGFAVIWTPGAEIDRLGLMWRRARLDARWCRGLLMAFWISSARRCRSDEVCQVATLESLQGLFADCLLGLESELEDRPVCTAHGSNRWRFEASQAVTASVGAEADEF